MNDTATLPGFADPVHDAQRSFRALLDALARPGRIHRLPAPPRALPGLGPAAAALALTLVDFETPVWLAPSCVPAAGFLRFHCGCPIVTEPEQAAFAFAGGFAELPALERFALGTEEEPERAATLVVEAAALGEGGALRLRGPGIAGECRVRIAGLDDEWLAARAALHALYPRGLDLFVTCAERVCGLPRTTRIDPAGAPAEA